MGEILNSKFLIFLNGLLVYLFYLKRGEMASRGDTSKFVVLTHSGGSETPSSSPLPSLSTPPRERHLTLEGAFSCGPGSSRHPCPPHITTPHTSFFPNVSLPASPLLHPGGPARLGPALQGATGLRTLTSRSCGWGCSGGGLPGGGRGFSKPSRTLSLCTPTPREIADQKGRQTKAGEWESN